MKRRAALLDGNPACWRWKVPTRAEAERLQAELRQERLEWTPDPEPLPDERLRWILMADMHKDRCAICGQRDRGLRKDHDHATGLVRGWLCPSCNTSEGYNTSGIFAKYRAINPAMMCGVREMYESEWGPTTIVLPPPDWQPPEPPAAYQPPSYTDGATVSILAAVAADNTKTVTAAELREFAGDRTDLLTQAAESLISSWRWLDLAKRLAAVQLLVEAGADESLIDGWPELQALIDPAA